MEAIAEHTITKGALCLKSLKTCSQNTPTIRTMSLREMYGTCSRGRGCWQIRLAGEERCLSVCLRTRRVGDATWLTYISRACNLPTSLARRWTHEEGRYPEAVRRESLLRDCKGEETFEQVTDSIGEGYICATKCTAGISVPQYYSTLCHYG